MLVLDAPNFQSSNSFAKVARYHARFLHDCGFALRLCSRSPERTTDSILDAREREFLASLHRGPARGQRITYCGPADLDGDAGTVYVTPFDTARVHPRWARCARKARHLVTHSHASRHALLHAGAPGHKITVAHHGVDPDYYFPGAEPLWSVDDRFTFLFLGHFHLRKGVDLLLRAFRDEFRAGEAVRLRLVTQSMFNEVPVVTQVKRILAGEPSDFGIELRVHPFNEGYPEREMARVYASAHCLVLPSRGEGFGLPALEARACGLEVIATRCGGMLDFLNEDNAHLVDVDSIEPNEHAAAYARESGDLEFWEPSYASLRRRMREVFEGARKPGTVATWTWARRLAPMRSLVESLL